MHIYRSENIARQQNIQLLRQICTSERMSLIIDHEELKKKNKHLIQLLLPTFPKSLQCTNTGIKWKFSEYSLNACFISIFRCTLYTVVGL